MARTAQRRPWYLVLTLVLAALAGAFGTASGCTAVSYLRGSVAALPEPSAELHPLLRVAVVRERAWLEALGRRHVLSFPLSAAQVLLGVVLLGASVAALTGRRGPRRVLVQALVACGVFAAVELALLGPVRGEVADAVGRDMAAHFAEHPDDGPSDGEIARYTQIAGGIEWGRWLFFEIVVLGGAALALTRARSRAFFDARERARGTAED